MFGDCVPIGSIEVPFGGSYLESCQVIPKRTIMEPVAYGYGEPGRDQAKTEPQRCRPSGRQGTNTPKFAKPSESHDAVVRCNGPEETMRMREPGEPPADFRSVGFIVSGSRFLSLAVKVSGCWVPDFVY